MATIATINNEYAATARTKLNDNFAALNAELVAATSAVAGKAGGTGTANGTNTGDNATNTQYSGLVSNATHTGDATGATALTLATVNSNVGSFTNASVTVNAKGLVTAASNGSTNAATATALATPRTIDGVSFDGSSNIVLTAWSTLSGTSPALTFTATQKAHTLTLTGNTTFTASGYAQGFRITLFLTGDSILDTLAFPAWTWLEGAPASLAATKAMRIDLVCTGATAASVNATYAVQA